MNSKYKGILSNTLWNKRLDKHRFWILGLILVYSIVLRVLFLGTDSMWIDESISAVTAQGIIDNSSPILESGAVYSRAEIFHYLMAGFILVFGGDFGARFVSVLFGVLTVYLGYIFGRKFIGKGFGGLGFALLLCVSSMEIIYSQQARFYQAFQFFYFLSFYLFYKIAILKESLFDKWKVKSSVISGLLSWICLVLSVMMTIHLQFMGYILLPLFLGVYIINNVFTNGLIRGIGQLFRDKVFMILGLIGVICGIYLAFRIQGMLSLDYFERSFYYGNLYSVFSWEYFPLMFLSLLGFIVALFNNWRLHLSLFSFVVIPFIGMFFVKFFATRYIYFATFFLFFYLVYLLSKMHFRVLIMLILFVFYAGYVFDFNGIKHPNYDFSMPVSDYKGAYEFVLDDINNLSELDLIATWTPASVWYGNGANYWINYSISGGSNSWIIYNETGLEKFANAVILNSVDDISRNIEMNSSDFVVVLDYQAKNKIGSSWLEFFEVNCDKVFSGYQIEVLLCDLG